MNEIQRSIIDAIKAQVNEKIKNLQFDKTCYGKVVTIRDNICDVEINGEITQCKIRNGLQINVNDIVLVRLINNDFSNKFVDAKLGTVGDDVEVEVDWSDIIGKPSSSPSDIDDSVSKKHTHNNLSLLETITQTLVNAWNSAVAHISDAVKHITSDERNLWNTVVNKVDKIEGKGLSTEDYTTEEKNKLAGIASGAEVNQNAFSNIKVGSSTISADSKTDTLEIAAGTGITITTDTTNDKITINGVNQYTHPNHTGDVTSIGDGVTIISNNVVTNAKLADMASNTVKGRKSSSTGDPEDISISDLKSMLALNNVTNEAQIPLSQKGVANGVAELDASGKVPSSQLPSYVDDVLEYVNLSSFPTTGETGKIYIAQDTNKTYRWSGSAYVEISASLALGETSSTAYRGDRGKVAYDHSQSLHAPVDAQKNSDITKAEIEAKLTGTISTHSHTLAGLSEKNYSSLVGRPVDDDFHTLTALIDSADDDELAIYDTSDNSYKKITKQNLFAGLSNSSQYVFIRKKEEFTSTEGQTVFNLTSGLYEIGTGRVDVYVWGNKQPPSAFTETSSTSITLVNGVEAGTKVLIEYIQIANVMDYIHAQNHKIGGSDPITPADIGAASQSHTHVKTDITDFSHTHSISEIANLQISLDGKVNTSDVVTTATANKILKLDSNANLPANITGNATTASKLQTARTITLSGDVSGSASFDGSSNITINATVADDSHNHVISNIDNLQSTLDAKASVSHTHTSSEITDFNEATQDAIGAILTDTSTIDFTYDDTNNQIKADVKPNSSNQKVAVSKNNTTPTGTRKQINFKDGTNISVTVADNAINDAVDVTITNTYTHPTGDGNLHVPATGTTNNNKVLKAGSTAGSLSWGNVDWSELTNKPSSSVSSIDNAVTNSHTHSNKALLDTYTQTEANLADAVSKKHTQNTDNTLTSSSSNTINTTGTGNIVDFKVNNTTKSSIDNNGNFTGKSASADKLATARTITLTGDVTGSASFDGSANISISATVADDSHNHVISNIDNLQTILDSKAPLASPAFTGIPTAPTAPNGTNTNQIATTAFVQNALSAGGYGDMLKSQYDTDSDGIVDRAETADKLTTARTISLSGDVTGSVVFDGSSNVNITATVVDNSHNHTIDNITNLQTSLDSKINKTGDTITGALISDVDIGTVDTRVYKNVVSYRNSSSSVTGTIKIALPKTWSNTMMRIHIKGYDYSSNSAWELVIGGYNYLPTPAWVNYSAELRGNAPFSQVRLGHDGSKCCILLGTISSVWQYPHIVVEEVIAGHSTVTGWEAGWTISVITDETGISYIVTPTLRKMWHSENDGSGSGMDADLLDGKHAGNSSNQIPISNGILCSNLNAERVNGTKITVGTTSPTSPSVNDIWIDTSS